eukprot:6203519-Pleurochrysis_carterae.AAC.1
MKHSSILSNDEGVFRSLPGRRSYAVATEPLAHAPPLPSCSSAFSLPTITDTVQSTCSVAPLRVYQIMIINIMPTPLAIRSNACSQQSEIVPNTLCCTTSVYSKSTVVPSYSICESNAGSALQHLRFDHERCTFYACRKVSMRTNIIPSSIKKGHAGDKQGAGSATVWNVSETCAQTQPMYARARARHTRAPRTRMRGTQAMRAYAQDTCVHETAYDA